MWGLRRGGAPDARGLAAAARAILVAAIAGATACSGSPASAPNNVLLLLADDIGVDRIAAYAAHPDPGHTPVLDDLARTGVRFETVWATPMCSASRAAILTGRLPWRTGVGGALRGDGLQPGLDLESGPPTLAQLAAARGVATFLIGKWHLTGEDRPDKSHVLRAGFQSYVGWPHNLPGASGYTRRLEYRDEEPARAVEGYVTVAEVDYAIAAIAAAREPWFGWIGFHAAHGPPHRPPGALHSYALSGPPAESGADHFRAAVEALDHEIGRLFASMSPALRARTTIVFAADNGTPRFGLAAPTPPRSGKHSLYEGGVRVPLIIASPLTPQARRGSSSRALVHVTDLYATIAEILGGDSVAEDSRSLVPYLRNPGLASERSVLYTERFETGSAKTPEAASGAPEGGFVEPRRWARAARDARFKLLVRAGGRRELYDLAADPWETRDLLEGSQLGPEAREALGRLEGVILARGAAGTGV